VVGQALLRTGKPIRLTAVAPKVSGIIVPLAKSEVNNQVDPFRHQKGWWGFSSFPRTSGAEYGIQPGKEQERAIPQEKVNLKNHSAAWWQI